VINGVALDGTRIVVAGYTTTGTDVFDWAVARYRHDGRLDTSFSGNGVRVAGFGPGANLDFANDVVVQADHRIVAAGRADVGGGDDDFGLMRFRSDGGLDSSFSGDGKQTTDFFGNDDVARAVALRGGIVVAGEADTASDTRIAVARYKTG
jgi:serralysin